VTVPVVVPVMMVVVSVTVTVMVVMMMVVMAPPHHAAVVMAVAPVVVADPEPRDIVDHIGVLNSRLHRRRGDDRRTCVRRHQRGTRHGDRRGSQAQKQLAHLGTSSRHVAHMHTLRVESRRLDVWRIQSRFNDTATSRRRGEGSV
jgi:hypothetical protein